MTQSYPNLKYQDIFEWCNTVRFMSDAKLSLTDFKKPETMRWRKIYASFFEYITNVKIETAIQRRNLKRPHVDFREIYDGGIATITFAEIVTQLMKHCRMEDFSFHDIIIAEGIDEKRLKNIVSALINFCKFKTQRDGMYSDIELAHEERSQQVNDVRQANREMREQIDELRNKRDKEAADAEQVRTENQELADAVNNLKLKAGAINKSYDAAKTKHEHLDMTIENAKMNRQELQQKGETLRMLHDYRNKLALLADMKPKLNEEFDSLNMTLRNKKTILKQMTEMNSELEGLMRLLKKCEENDKACVKANDDAAQKQREILDAESVLVALTSEEEECRAVLAKTQETYDKVKLQMERKIASMEQTLLEQRTKNEIHGCASSLNRKKEEITKNMEKRLKDTDEKIKCCKEQKKKIIAEDIEYKKQLLAEFREIIQALGPAALTIERIRLYVDTIEAVFQAKQLNMK